MNAKKLLAAAIAAALVANLVLLALRLVSFTVFWAVIIASALIAYKVIPKMHSK